MGQKDEIVPLSEKDISSDWQVFGELSEEMIGAEWASSSVLNVGALDEAVLPSLNPLHGVEDVRLVPFRGIASLRIVGPGNHVVWGSAFVVAPHLLITAGHNLFFHDPAVRGRVLAVTAFPGRNGTTAIASLSGTGWNASAQWVAGNALADYGAIRVAEDLTALIPFEMRDLPTIVAHPPASVAGYPAAQGGHLFAGESNVGVREPTRFAYAVATLPGQSGGPVWLDGTRFAVGIHTLLNGVAVASRLTPSIQMELSSLV